MNFIAWFHHINKYINNALSHSIPVNHHNISPQKSENKTTDNKQNLRKKNNKAAQEVNYIKSFTYWPIAKTKSIAKVITVKNTLVYLKTNSIKRQATSSDIQGTNKNIASIVKARLAKTTPLTKKTQ